MKEKQYLCIDLKSFYASVECVERGLDPMTTNLVVADPDRSSGTICLAVTPAMKRLGVKNRCRIFQIPSNISYITAPPRMQTYIDYSANIYGIYLKYISREDIHVYSVDEAFMDVTDYLELYQMNAKELGQQIMDDIRTQFGIQATCGIGTNLYLAKIALDITAKHATDFIGILDEESYRDTLWNHRPLTDFWRVGKGTVKKLESLGICTMGDIAKADENVLYHSFGIDAELLIDHAWGIEPTTIANIKSYRSQSNSLSSSQVLMRDYSFEEGKLIVKEMTDLLCLTMTNSQVVSKSFTLQVGYSHEFKRTPGHGSIRLEEESNVAIQIIPEIVKLYEKIVNPNVPIRRFTITCNHILPEEYYQYNFLCDYEKLEKARKMQKTVLKIKNKFGKNAILKGMNLEKSATTRERNMQIGGHKSGKTS